MKDPWGQKRTETFAGEMPEHATVQVVLGENDGNSTRTAVQFAFEGGVAPTVTIEKRPDDDGISWIRIELVGEWEREGFARAMIAAATELLKK